MLGVPFGLLGIVGELHAAGLHAAAGEDLRFDDDRPGDLLGDPPSLLRCRGEAVLCDRNAGLGDDRPGFVFEEAHGDFAIYRSCGMARGLPRASERLLGGRGAGARASERLLRRARCRSARKRASAQAGAVPERAIASASVLQAPSR